MAINYKTQDFVAETKKATGGKGAEVIIDMVAGDYIQKNYDAAAMDGRIVQIAFQRPPKAMVDFRPILMKRLWHTGSGLRPRPVPEKAAIARAVEENVWPLIAGRQGQASDLQDLSLARSGGCACADGDQRAYRQDRADCVADPPQSRRAAITNPPRRGGWVARRHRVPFSVTYLHAAFILARIALVAALLPLAIGWRTPLFASWRYCARRVCSRFRSRDRDRDLDLAARAAARALLRLMSGASLALAICAFGATAAIELRIPVHAPRRACGRSAAA